MQATLDSVQANPKITSMVGHATHMCSPAITAKTSKKAVNLPLHGPGPAYWGYGGDDRVTITFKQLMDVTCFSLDNALFKLGDEIVKQVHGIPMGDPLSPAICIATCTYFENKWFNTLSKTEKENIFFCRYMDDIHMVTDSATIPSLENVAKDFETKCYPNSLVLESTDAAIFLECTLATDPSTNRILLSHNNKNHTHITSFGKQRYYKQQDYKSYTSHRVQRGTLIGLWTRMMHNSNDDSLLHTKINERIREMLHTLHYPTSPIICTLTHMLQKHKTLVWNPSNFKILRGGNDEM
jgi:hypothetical protein